MKVVSEKGLFVNTPWGSAVNLIAGVEVELNDTVALEAIRQGATHVITATKEKVVYVTKPEADTLVTALEKLMDEGDPKNFKADGYPKASIVKSIMGQAYSADEVSEAWESVLNS